MHTGTGRPTRPLPDGDAQTSTSTTTTTTTPKRPHHLIHASSDRPSLLRLPSTTSTLASTHSRRASNPAARTPARQPSHSPSPSAAPSSYFAPSQPSTSTANDVRSPTTRRPPASFSSFGKAYGDNSRGPPISASGTWPKQDTTTPTRSFSVSTDRMATFNDTSSAYDPLARPRLQTRRTQTSRHEDTDTSGAEGDGEDLFLHVAQDSANDTPPNAASRTDRVRSRIARTNRQSLPASIPSSSPQTSGIARPNGTKIPSAIDTQAGSQYRRSTFLPSSTRASREQSPLTPSNPILTPRTRVAELSPRTRRSTTSLAQDKDQESDAYSVRAGASSRFSPKDFVAQVEAVKARQRDSTLSPKDFLAQFEAGKRRPSYPDALQTPPGNRNGAFKPSNLHYHSSSRDNHTVTQIDTQPDAPSRYEGTDSHDSTGAATSMWDELDELKTRMKRLEMGGKIPATSGAAIAQASADRPRTANTSATTVSSSPNQPKKPTSSESTLLNSTSSKAYPLLREALAKVKLYASPAVYRALDATAQEALALAEMAGGSGPQGTFHSTNSILGGSSLPDRQVRRKADHICRNLTELCIELCDKSSFVSPAVQRTSAATVSRRPSLQINGESPIRQSIEPESDTLPRSSPSRAMTRIEARRSSIMNRRESSQEPPTPSQPQAQPRLDRAGTSMYRRRGEPEDDDPTLRAPSRAMTDFRNVSTRTANKSRFSREYTSQEPMPNLQPSPTLQTPVNRRSTLNGAENSLLYRDADRVTTSSLGKRRYGLTSQVSPATTHDKRSLEPVTRTQIASNRNSIGGSFPLGRSASLSRRRVNAD